MHAVWPCGSDQSVILVDTASTMRRGIPIYLSESQGKALADFGTKLKAIIGTTTPTQPHLIATTANKRRLALLITAIVLMGLADLALTLIYLRSIGMVEMNPIARMMISIGQTRQLVLFKLLTITVSIGCLIIMRHHRWAERAAWCAAALLLGLMFYWVSYNNSLSALTNEITLLVSGDEQSDYWVRIDS